MAPHAFPELLRHRGDDFAGKAPRARKALFKNIVLVEQLQPEMGVLRRQADIVDTRRRREMLRRVHASSRQRNTGRSEEHTSELQSLMRISYAVFCLKKKKPSHLINTQF